MKKIYIIGYGNPGRIDDGLGPACIRLLESLRLDKVNITLDSNYQLTVETAIEISNHDEVIFIDASIEQENEGFYFKRLKLVQQDGFNTHSISPEALMQLTRCLYHKTPKAWMLGIRGYQFDSFGEYLSEGAQLNLNLAFQFLKSYLLKSNDIIAQPKIA